MVQFLALDDIVDGKERKYWRTAWLGIDFWSRTCCTYMNVTRHLNNLNRDLQGEHKCITKCTKIPKPSESSFYCVIMKLHNLFHFSHLIFLDPVYSEHILQNSQPINLLREEFDKRWPGLQNYGTRISVCFTFTGRLWQTCRISVNGINLKCDTNLETELQDFHAYMSQENFPLLRSFLDQNYCNVQ